MRNVTNQYNQGTSRPKNNARVYLTEFLTDYLLPEASYMYLQISSQTESATLALFKWMERAFPIRVIIKQ